MKLIQGFSRLIQFKQQRGWLAILGAIATLGIILIQPATAFQVQVMPSSPQLGDTLSVMVQQPTTDATTVPSVQYEGKTYPMFAVGSNQYRVLLPTTPLDSPGNRQIQVNSGGQQQNISISLRDRQFPTQSIWLPPDKQGLTGTDFEFDQVDAFKALVTPDKYWQGAFLRPSSGPVSTIYGVRRYYNGEFAENYYHRGVDYAAGTGSPVVAPAAGRVALVGREADGFTIHGNVIGIDHGQGVAGIFVHLNRIDVKAGDMVTAGQVIGGVGSTGSSTGPHLHWGVYVQGQAVDPVPWRYDEIN
ncbi:MAG: M23 family metallopeptidase [Microcoleaceae cyanobacterium]